MKRVLSILLVAYATSCFAITPTPTPGENVWDLTARIGEELDSQIDFGLSLVEVIDSKVDAVDQTVEGIASCCEQAQQQAGAITVLVDILDTKVTVEQSFIEEIQDVDLVRIESKVDAAAGIIEQSVHDEFIATWTLLHDVISTVGVVESNVDSVDSVVEVLSSLVDEIKTTELPVVESKIDAIESDLAFPLSLCDEIQTVDLSRIESILDAIDNVTDAYASGVEVLLDTDLPRIESKIDAIDVEVSVIDDIASATDSIMDYVESKVDALSGGGGGASCSGTPITQADVTAAGGTLTIGTTVGFTAPGYYCLTQNITGTIQINQSNVTLDLNGHTITSLTGTGNVIAINSAQSHVVIRNGTITDTANAANFKLLELYGTDIIVEDIYFNLFVPSSNGSSCISIADGVVQTATQVTVRRCDIRALNPNLFLVSGIHIFGGASHITVTDVTVNGNYDHILIDSASALLPISAVHVKHCTFTNTINFASLSVSGDFITDLQVVDCFFEAVFLSINIVAASVGGVSDVLVERCHILNTGTVGSFPEDMLAATRVNKMSVIDSEFITGRGSGVALYGVTNAYVARNKIMNTTFAGIRLDASTVGVVEYNTAEFCGAYGIVLINSVTHFSVEHNDVANNGAINIAWDAATIPQNNTIVANKALTNGGNANNYSDVTLIPTIEWDRSTATATVISGGAAVTGWHNWSSIA